MGFSDECDAHAKTKAERDSLKAELAEARAVIEARQVSGWLCIEHANPSKLCKSEAKLRADLDALRAIVAELLKFTAHDGEGHSDPDPSTDCKKVYYSGTEPCSCGLDDLLARARNLINPNKDP